MPFIVYVRFSIITKSLYFLMHTVYNKPSIFRIELYVCNRKGFVLSFAVCFVVKSKPLRFAVKTSTDFCCGHVTAFSYGLRYINLNSSKLRLSVCCINRNGSKLRFAVFGLNRNEFKLRFAVFGINRNESELRFAVCG